MTSRVQVVIECNLGGCVLVCSHCGPLDQGDSPEAMERMRRTKKSHEAKHRVQAAETGGRLSGSHTSKP